MRDQGAIAGRTEPLRGSQVGALLGFTQRLAEAHTADRVFAAFAAFASEERIGALLMEVDGAGESRRWSAVDEARLRCFDESGVAGTLIAQSSQAGLPRVVGWGLCERADFHTICDPQASQCLRAADLAGGLCTAMDLPSGRKARAVLLAGQVQLETMPQIAGDLFLMVGIQAFLALDRCLGPIPPKGLTRRELEALRLSARGLSMRAIAEAMRISEATVKFHLMGARRKTRTGSTREAIAILSADIRHEKVSMHQQ